MQCWQIGANESSSTFIFLLTLIFTPICFVYSGLGEGKAKGVGRSGRKSRRYREEAGREKGSETRVSNG